MSEVLSVTDTFLLFIMVWTFFIMLLLAVLVGKSK